MEPATQVHDPTGTRMWLQPSEPLGLGWFFHFKLQTTCHYGSHTETDGDTNQGAGQGEEEQASAVHKLQRNQRLQQISYCFVATEDETRQ